MKTNQIDMRTGSIFKKLISFAIPLMLTSMLQLLYNAADVVVVGNFAGTHALSAVGATGPLINIVINVFMGLSIGTAVLVSKAYGANDPEQMSKTVHTSILVSFIGGIAITIIGVFFTRPLLELMNTPDDVIGGAVTYTQIFFLGSIFNMVYNFGAAALRAVGDTQRPLRILAVSGIVNILLNLLLVIVFEMSVAGVAIATITAQAISSVWVIKCLITEKGGLKLNIKKLYVDMEVLINMAKIGLPAGLQGSLFSISNAMIQSSINIFGSTAIAANAAAGNLEGFMFVGLNTMNQASLTFASQNLGARQYKRIRKSYFVCLGLIAGVYVFICMPFYIFSNTLVSFYDSNPEVMRIGAERLQFIACIYFLWGILDVTVGQMRGLGSSLVPTLVSLIGICGFRVFWLSFVFPNYQNLTTLYMSYPISWILTILSLIPFYMLILKRLPKEDLAME